MFSVYQKNVLVIYEYLQRNEHFYMQMMQGEYFREYWRSQMETFHSYKKKSVNVVKVKQSRFTSLNY